MNQAPLPPFPPLVLQQLPVPNPALPQPNWNVLSAAMQTMAVEAVNIPNSNPMQQIIAMNQNMTQLVQAFNQVQAQVVATHNAVITSNQLLTEGWHYSRSSLQLVPMRSHNAAATASTHLRYPPGVPAPVAVGGAMPITLADAVGLTGPQSVAAVNALIAAGAPGLLPVPLNAPALAKRRHFLDYMGIYGLHMHKIVIEAWGSLVSHFAKPRHRAPSSGGSRVSYGAGFLGLSGVRLSENAEGVVSPLLDNVFGPIEGKNGTKVGRGVGNQYSSSSMSLIASVPAAILISVFLPTK
ncbi:hypothetical protein DFH07DRAFT_777547, partial [Mycena maculata]